MPTRIDLDDLRLVVAVAQHRSFAAAARSTGVPLSTLSRAVARLEEGVGVRLFQRTSRRVAPTADGARLVERAAPLVGEIGELIDDISDHARDLRGRLRVTAPLVSGSGPIGTALAAFAEAHPNVTVELSLTNAVVDLVEEGYDLAFRAGPVEGPDLVARRVWTAPFAVGASEAFVRRELGGRTAVDRAALESRPAIVARPGTRWRFRREGGVAVEILPKPRFCVNDPRVALEAAQRGLGMVNAQLDRIEAAGLVVLRPSADLGQPAPRELFAVVPTRRHLPRRVRAAIEWVTRALAAPAAGR